MNSKQRRARRRVVSSIRAHVRAELEHKIQELQRRAGETEQENIRLRKVRVEFVEERPWPHSFNIPCHPVPTESVKLREVKIEMMRFAVSVPLDVARKSSLPDLSCKKKALDSIYEAFKTRAAANIDFYYDDLVKVYSASIVLPVVRQGSY